MKKIFTLIVGLGLAAQSFAQVVINEIDFATKSVEIKNVGTTSVDVSNYWLCNFPSYSRVGVLTVSSGSPINLASGEFLVVVFDKTLNLADGELGLYDKGGSFSSSSAIVDYVEWGKTGHQRSSVAVQAGTWTTGSFVAALTTGQSIEFDGLGNTSADFQVVTATTLGAENASVTGVSASVVEKVSVYPNPTTDFILVEQENVQSVTVYTTSGSVMATTTTSNKIDVSTYPKGIYFVEVQFADAKKSVTKVIKQ